MLLFTNGYENECSRLIWKQGILEKSKIGE